MKTCGVVSENLRGWWWKPVELLVKTCGVAGENPWGCLRKLVELFVTPFG